MPSLGADMAAATIVEWLVKPGDYVTRGDVIAVVETEKGAIEIEIFEEGTIQEILVPVGEKTPVGMALARLDGDTDVAPVVEKTPAIPPQPRKVEQKPMVSPIVEPSTLFHSSQPAKRLRISPVARQRAKELNIDPATLTGSGLGGAIVLADVEAATVPQDSAPTTPDQAEPAKTAMRNAIAAAMSRANREIPHYYLSTPIDMEPALAWLEATNRERPVTERLLYGVLLLKAVGLALKQMPDLNGFWDNDGFRPGDGIHVGWSVALRGGGLVAPAIHNVDQKPLEQLMTEFRDLVKRARRGGLRSSEMMDATITVTSLGEQGVRSVFGIIYPPQVGLIGFGKVHERPWANNGMIGVHRVIETTLAGDHRASDGHRGGLLLSAIERLLQEPDTL